ncbi:MAG: hypothetical protein QNK17_02770, partial [Hyphomicrobiaceae bacterium]|nr:hypothetical protein [Hyphomicrobiaceae bacterium]MDX2449340.1 hypothetical protein [Hyphomicrobiaceae bacterium]
PGEIQENQWPRNPVLTFWQSKRICSDNAAEDAVDTALAGLDRGELVTIPGLHEGEAWKRWEADRRELSKKFGNAKPAPRYGVKPTVAA